MENWILVCRIFLTTTNYIIQHSILMAWCFASMNLLLFTFMNEMTCCEALMYYLLVNYVDLHFLANKENYVFLIIHNIIMTNFNIIFLH